MWPDLVADTDHATLELAQRCSRGLAYAADGTDDGQAAWDAARRAAKAAACAVLEEARKEARKEGES